MKHYKIVHGYSIDEYIPITENELAKAIAIFMEGHGRATFENGAIRGQDIMRIVPDWNSAMGWTKAHKMVAEDYAEIRGLEVSYKKIYESAKVLAEYAIKTGNPRLLSVPLEEGLLEIPASTNQKLINDAVSILVDKIKVV